MLVALHGEREAAAHVMLAVLDIANGLLERAAREHGFLRRIKGNLPKLGPVERQRVVADNVVDGQLSLVSI